MKGVARVLMGKGGRGEGEKGEGDLSIGWANS